MGVWDGFRPFYLWDSDYSQAIGKQAVESIWQLRREFSYSLRDTGLVKLNQDIVVPRGCLIELLEFADRLQKKHSIPVACFGHAGDGNIHVNVMVDDAKSGRMKFRNAALDELFRWVVKSGGVERATCPYLSPCPPYLF